LDAATLGPLGALAAFLVADFSGVGELEAVGEGDGGADEGGADEVGPVLAGGAAVSPSAAQAPKTVTPPPVSAAKLAARSTVRRVGAVEADGDSGRSDMGPPWRVRLLVSETRPVNPDVTVRRPAATPLL
jgi:hypothetical protein